MQGTDKEKDRLYLFKKTALNNLGLSLRAAAIVLTRAGFCASTSALLAKWQKATCKQRSEMKRVHVMALIKEYWINRRMQECIGKIFLRFLLQM